MKEDWKAERLKEEQEKLDQGEGYGDMIKDQIWGCMDVGTGAGRGGEGEGMRRS